jgi:hypothetical protein
LVIPQEPSNGEERNQDNENNPNIDAHQSRLPPPAGVVFSVGPLAAKLLGILHELVPKASIIAVLRDPNRTTHRPCITLFKFGGGHR